MGFGFNSWGKATGEVGSAFGAMFKEGPSTANKIVRGLVTPFRWAAEGTAYVAALPVRGAAKLVKFSPGLAFIGTVAAGSAMAYAAFSNRSGNKDIAPEMEQMQNQVVSNQQQLEMIAQAQQEQAMAAQMMAGGVPGQAVANANNPTTRLQVGNMAQLQGLAAMPTSQMARA
jgi:hypothetical protein